MVMRRARAANSAMCSKLCFHLAKPFQKWHVIPRFFNVNPPVSVPAQRVQISLQLISDGCAIHEFDEALSCQRNARRKRA
jgi:hypothetical protein